MFSYRENFLIFHAPKSRAFRGALKIEDFLGFHFLQNCKISLFLSHRPECSAFANTAFNLPLKYPSGFNLYLCTTILAYEHILEQSCLCSRNLYHFYFYPNTLFIIFAPSIFQYSTCKPSFTISLTSEDTATSIVS